MNICISKKQIENLLYVLKERQKSDVCVSDFIEIELVEERSGHLESDKLKFSARSIYAECNNHFLGTN